MDIGNIVDPFRQQAPLQQAAAPMGSFGGHTIVVNDPHSLVMNAAEEAGFALSEREEARLEARKMKPRGPDLERIEQIHKYTDMLEKQGKGPTLGSYLSALARREFLFPRDAMQEARRFFGDSADAYAALLKAKETLGNQFGEDVFLEAMEQLEDIAGKEIKTRMAAGIAAMEHAALGDAEQLKSLYQDTLVDLGSPMDIYDRILTDYGETRFEEALGFLTKSLGNQMAATTINTDRVQLEGISRDLGTVRLLHGLNSQCRQLVGRTEKTHGSSGLNSTDMVREVLKLRDAHFVGPFDIEAIADKVGVHDIEARIHFFQDFMNMARELPENLFPESSARLNLIDATQAALDDAIAVEDQLYES